MKRVLIVLGGGLALAVVAVVAFVATLDLDRYKPLIAEQVQVATGRALAIGGHVRLALSLTPSIVAERVSFANAQWGSEPQMATVARFEGEIALLPLLRGEVRIRRLVLVEPSILLETRADGRPNWSFASAAGAPAPARGALPALSISDVRIERARIRYRSAASGARYEVEVAHARAHADGVAAPIAIAIDAAWSGTPVHVEGEVGALGTLAADARYPLDLTAKAAGARLTVKGALDAPLSHPSLALDTALDAPSTAALAPADSEHFRAAMADIIRRCRAAPAPGRH